MVEENIMADYQIEPLPEMITEIRKNRFSKIFSNIAYTSAILALIALLATLVVPLLNFLAIVILFIIIACIVIFSFGAVFAIENNPVPRLWEILSNLTNQETTFKIVDICVKSTLYISIIGICFAVAALLMTIFTKKNKKAGSIVGLSIIIGILVIYLIIYFVLGGSIWQS